MAVQHDSSMDNGSYTLVSPNGCTVGEGCWVVVCKQGSQHCVGVEISMDAQSWTHCVGNNTLFQPATATGAFLCAWRDRYIVMHGGDVATYGAVVSCMDSRR